MRFARILAATAVVVAVGAFGTWFLAPAAAGQERAAIIARGEGPVEVSRWGGSKLGASVRDVDRADVSREKLPAETGAVVEEVTGDSPASKAGLKAGDVILEFDGQPVRSARQLERLVDETPAGRTVKMAVQRNGARVDLEVTPEASRFAWRGRELGPFDPERDLPEVRRRLERALPRAERQLRRRLPAYDFDFDFDLMVPGRPRLGVQVQELSGDLPGYFGVKSGVLVAGVDADSPAAKAGLKAGDVITAVNGQSVDSPMELRREINRVEGKTAQLSVTRDRKAMDVKVELPEREERRVRRTI
ncbi:MAG TPA: PDZ domain-containing protein [Vicinamibacterales bacterium]